MANALAPNIPHKITGIRAGEKLNEVMIPRDDARLCVEFKDFYLLKPTINFNTPIDYTCTALGERGVAVEADFEYSSHTNTQWLKGDEILSVLG